MKYSALVVLASLSFIVPASATDKNFSIAETENGTVRLDRRSGEVSFCRKINGGMACSMAADERDAWVQATEGMAKRIDELEKRIVRLEAAADIGPPLGPRSKDDNEQTPELSQREERQIDKAMRVMENVARRFIGIVKELKRDFESN